MLKSFLSCNCSFNVLTFAAVADRTPSQPKCLFAPYDCFRSLFCPLASLVMPFACQSCLLMKFLRVPLLIHQSLGPLLTDYWYQLKVHYKISILEFFLFVACGTTLLRPSSVEASCLLSEAFFSCGSFVPSSRFWPLQSSRTFHAKVIISNINHLFS